MRVTSLSGAEAVTLTSRLPSSPRRGSAQIGEAAAQRRGVEAEAQAAGGGFFEVMRFVDDQIAIIGQDAAFHRRVGDQQGVVDDQHAGGFGGFARLVERARARHDRSAAVERAAFVFGAQALPGLVFLRAAQRNLAPVAGLAFQQPDQNFRQRAQFVNAGRAAAADGLQAARAEVIGASLHHRGGERAGRARRAAWGCPCRSTALAG